jgi:hypothetical protein
MVEASSHLFFCKGGKGPLPPICELGTHPLHPIRELGTRHLEGVESLGGAVGAMAPLQLLRRKKKFKVKKKLEGFYAYSSLTRNFFGHFPFIIYSTGFISFGTIGT